MTFIAVEKAHTKVGSIYTEEGKKKKANKPNWEYDADAGLYTIQGVVERGYLQAGEHRMEFIHTKEGR
jgi:hypothetical protein